MNQALRQQQVHAAIRINAGDWLVRHGRVHRGRKFFEDRKRCAAADWFRARSVEIAHAVHMARCARLPARGVVSHTEKVPACK